ncbi:MAG: LysR family transcriptional regulator [Desulfobacteraceae bacterium]|nr:MAG: LysR family transcriptional regulator [Desulfobacteraceae bacterium]
MNLNQLKIFYYTVKQGSLSAAAEALFITQPAVTKGLQRLQETYDILLFNRFGKKFVMTDAGEALYEIAEKIFELETHAEESLRDYQQRRGGRIRILTSESFGAYYLPSIIAPFCRSNPHIRVMATLLPTELVVENTAALNNDIGFISYEIEHPKLVVHEILSDRLIIIAAPSHPLAGRKTISPGDLDGFALIMHEKGSAPRKAIDELIRKYNVSVTIPLELSSNRAIKRAVAEGIGLGVVPEYVGSEEVETGNIIPIFVSDPTMSRKYYMVHHKDKYLSEPLRRLIDEVNRWAESYSKTVLLPDRHG